MLMILSSKRFKYNFKACWVNSLYLVMVLNYHHIINDYTLVFFQVIAGITLIYETAGHPISEVLLFLFLFFVNNYSLKSMHTMSMNIIQSTFSLTFHFNIIRVFSYSE